MPNLKVRNEISDLLRILIYFFLAYYISDLGMKFFVYGISSIRHAIPFYLLNTALLFVGLLAAFLSLVFLFKKHKCFFQSFNIFLGYLLCFQIVNYSVRYFLHGNIRLPANVSMHYQLMLPMMYALGWKFLNIRNLTAGINRKVKNQERSYSDDFNLGWMKYFISFYLIMSGFSILAETAIEFYRFMILRGAFLEGAFDPLFSIPVAFLSFYAVILLFRRRTQFIFTFKLIIFSKLFLSVVDILSALTFKTNYNKHGWQSLVAGLVWSVVIAGLWFAYVYRSKKLSKYCIY
ncbi:hypothetical protein ABMA79_07700 [Halobacteriovorax sp. HFRX-2_2]|uniref:hypothetical protein n=1 Tax=unclassified Halobacteriovorax TaxID=2639665 RepID=UPI00371FB19D